LTVLDYRGGKTTLCAGCGHNAITERIIDAMYEMGVKPENLAKLSGIGCSSKSPAYFANRAHGFNSVHGRMPSVATGVALANQKLLMIGVSGDGDTASIGIGQFIHLMRRNLPIIYIIEDNGVYGLTKGQFSATADLGSKLKTGVINDLPPIDTCALAIQLGATFVARSFSGDKKQLLNLLKAAIAHRGTVMLDVISPCVTFNDHEGSTKSYEFTREHYHPAVEADFVPQAEEIAVDYPAGEAIPVSLHDGSRVVLRKLDPSYDPTDRTAAYNFIENKLKQNEYVTGLIHIDETDVTEFHNLNKTSRTPLNRLPFEKLSPGGAALDKLMGRYR
jgi:2-oxoglutarate ferredoxin oxidoreductase subunit beta